MIAGHSNGQLGIWSRVDGRKLRSVRLHGAVTHLAVDGTALHAVSELGHHTSLDLAIFEQDYCELMREVWAAIPVVWHNGRPAAREPPANHRCAE